MNELIMEVKDELERRGYDVTIRDTPKVNGIRQGLSIIRPDGEMSITPAFYNDSFLDMQEDGKNIIDMANAVITETFSFSGSRLKFSDCVAELADRDYALKHATLCVCNRDWNEAFLSVTPHMPVVGTDLAVYPRIWTDDNSSMIVSKDYLQLIDVTDLELMTAAKRNDAEHVRIRPLTDVIADLMGVEPEPTQMPIVVITNDKQLYGASALVDDAALEEARQACGADEVYVIPSSVHEVLVIPTGFGDPEGLAGLIREINASEVEAKDRLGDHPYIYDGKKLSMTHERELAKEGRSR